MKDQSTCFDKNESICFNKNKIDLIREEIKTNDFAAEAALHKALSNKNRLLILHILNMEACCVCDLSHIMNTPVPTISHYLRVLREEELIQSEQNGKFIVYSLTAKARRLGISG